MSDEYRAATVEFLHSAIERAGNPSQWRLARRTGLDRASIMHAVRGHHAPRADNFLRMIDACGCKLVMRRKLEGE